MTNGSLRYGHSILWQSAENTWPLTKSSATFWNNCNARTRKKKKEKEEVFGLKKCGYLCENSSVQLRASSLSELVLTGTALLFSHTKARGVTFSRPASPANWGLYRAQQSTPHTALETGLWGRGSKKKKKELQRLCYLLDGKTDKRKQKTWASICRIQLH